MLRLTLLTSGFDVSTSSDARHALEQLARERPDAVLIDLGYGDMGEEAFLDEVRARDIAVPILVVTNTCPRADLRQRGAAAVLPKPFRADTVVSAIERAARTGIADDRASEGRRRG
jgi:DNA-binding NtrC family response regulator